MKISSPAPDGISLPIPDPTPELKQQLEGRPITPGQTLSLEGETFDFLVCPWDSEEEPDRFDLMISAFQKGGKRASLETTLAAHGRAQGYDLLRVSRSTRRGDLVLPSLVKDTTYRLKFPVSFGKSLKSLVDVPGDLSLAAATYPVGIVQWTNDPFFCESEDGRLRMTLRRTGRNETVVAVETSEESLAGATVSFSFVQAETAKVMIRHEMILRPVEDEESLWEGRWEGPIPLPEACDLFFEVEE